MGVGILAKRVVLELSSSTNFVYSVEPTGKLARGIYGFCPLMHKNDF